MGHVRVPRRFRELVRLCDLFNLVEPMKLIVSNFRKLHPYGWALVYSVFSAGILIATYSVVSGHRWRWGLLIPAGVWIAGCLIGASRDSKSATEASVHVKNATSFRAWRIRLSTERTARPEVLRIASAIYTILLLLSAGSIIAGIVSAAASVRSFATTVIGTFGMAAVGLGLLLALDYKGSARAAERWSTAFQSGPITFSGPSTTSVQTFRRLGVMLSAFGVALAAFSWSGVDRWHT